VEGLPLPERGPPARVGPADRIDKPDAIRGIAKVWHNCLADYLGHIEDGRCAAYQWLAPPGPIIALVQRHGRFGWFLEQIGSANNGEIAQSTREMIKSVFHGIGIPSAALVEPVEALLNRGQPSDRPRVLTARRSLRQTKKSARRAISSASSPRFCISSAFDIAEGPKKEPRSVCPSRPRKRFGSEVKLSVRGYVRKRAICFGVIGRAPGRRQLQVRSLVGVGIERPRPQFCYLLRVVEEASCRFFAQRHRGSM
jgi:hypothetical protein